MAVNPNWPVLDYAVCWAAGRGASTSAQDLWSSVTERTEGQVSITRGKTYELDQVQPGEATVTLRNDDGAFDPGNSSSPYFGYVIPYRLLRIRGQWSPTVNLLTADQATARYATVGSYTGSTLPQWVAQVGTQTLSIINVGTTNAYQVAYAGSAAAGQGVQVGGFSVAPGVTYSVQVQAKLSAAVTMSGQLSIVWYRANGTVLSTSSATAVALSTGGASLTLTAAAPALACGARVTLLNTTVPASAVNLQASLLQLEKASAPTSWVQPGTWYSFFVGYVEAWPQGWSSAGNYGTVDLTAVDLFAYWSQLPLQDPFIMDVLALNPNFYYPLNEGKAASLFADASGKRPSIYFYYPSATYLASGSTVQSSDNGPIGTNGQPLTGAFLGSAGPVVTSTPGPNRTVNGYVWPATTGGALAIPPDPSTGNIGTPVSGPWTRIIAARLTPGVAVGASQWSCLWSFQALPGGPYYGSSTQVPAQAVQITQQFGNIGASIAGAASPGNGTSAISSLYGNQFSSGSPSVAVDGDWHLYMVAYDPSNPTVITIGADGSLFTLGSSGNATPDTTARNNPAFWVDLLGAQSTTGGLIQWAGDFAHVMEFPFVISSTQFAALNESWRNAWGYNPNNTAESSDVRYQRVLSWAGYAGPSRISAGACLEYGPATDITGGTNPTMALAALQAVVETEAGQHFVAADGTIVFQSRDDRFSKAPTVTFGENTGEVAYLDATIDFDPTLIGNTAQVTSQYANVPYTSEDAGSVSAYGQIGLTRTVNSLNPLELQDAANYLVYVYKQPVQRLEALPVDVGANPSYWPTLLGLELGSCVQVNRRPSGAPNVVTVNGFLEQIVWTLGEDGSAGWSAQVSNSANHQFCRLDDSTYGLLDSTAVLGY